jgi:hypothetical protein
MISNCEICINFKNWRWVLTNRRAYCKFLELFCLAKMVSYK